MKKVNMMRSLAGGLTLIASGALHAVVSGDLLTNATVTTGWQNCDGSDLIGDTVDTFDPTHLSGEGCAYRETAAEPGQRYRMTCGVSSYKYSSMTMAFLDADGVTLSERTTEIFENVDGGAYSVVLTAPAGTTTAAVGIYGLEGSGFQDCVLIPNNPAPEPVDGSISGLAWFDKDENSLRINSEGVIPGTPVSIYLGNTLVDEMVTELDGSFYFGGLDLGQCYVLNFEPADPTLTYANSGGDNAIVADGATLDICLTDATPNVADILGGFIAVPPPAPPEDYAICGKAFLENTGPDELLPGIEVTLTNVTTGEQTTLSTGENGRFAFNSLPAGDYKLTYISPAAFSFIQGSNDLTVDSSFAGPDGMSSQFNLPADSNTGADAACTIRYANVGFIRTPVALDPTIANDDSITGDIGENLSVFILQNDAPCDGSALEVDLIGHNVPGTVTYNASNQAFIISNTTASGTYSIEYGLRGACGSYDTATIIVIIEELPIVPVANAP